jgi:hypothetical protein
MKTAKAKRSLLLTLFVIYGMLISGQTDQLETDKGIDASIAPYEADVRQAILQASQYPQILTALQKSQSQTIASFQNMIQGLRKKKQTWFYTLSRYPALLHTLATLPDRQSQEAVYKLLPRQDPDLQKAAWKLYKNEKKNLVKMDNIKISAEQDFDKTIQNLSAPAKAAFLKLSTMPDILTLMTNNIDLTTKLGEHYKDNPSELEGRLTAIHDSLNVQSQYETETLKKQIADDPKAAEELSQAAKDYASDNGYDPPTQQNDNIDNGGSYYADPYSYWFGYPYWYASPMWYPGSFWYESGFYMGLGGFGFYGFPSYGFSTWFFQGNHYNRYPHLYHEFGNYYQRNMAEGRVLGGVNHGFMNVANNHFSPNGVSRMNHLTSPSSFRRSAGQSYHTSGRTFHSNASNYHAQSWSSYGGRGNAVGSFRGGSGGMHSGGGSRGGGGGMHAGGGRR